jgi:phage terminase large subunit-like protein
MDGTVRADRYINGVLDGTILAPKLIILACERHRRDLERTDIYYDKEEANRQVWNMELLTHAKGRWQGQKIHLEDHQCFLMCSVFGWMKTATKTRRFRYVYSQKPRKNGKTLEAILMALIMLGPDGEPGAEVYLGAQSEESAKKILYAPTKYIVDNNEGFRTRYGIETAQSSIVIPANFSTLQAVIKKPGDGFSPSFACCDEFHEAQTDEQWDTFNTGMGARLQGILLVCTTAGYSVSSPCKTMRDDCVRMLEGTSDDDSTFAIIYEPDPGDDWQDPATLGKVNPNMGVSVSEEYLLDQLKRARRSATLQNAFKTKHLNTWCGARTAFMNMVAWQKQKHDFRLEDFAGEECEVGLDLASKKDLCAASLVFRRGTEYYTFHKFWCPESAAEDNRDYQMYANQGHLVLTPGNMTDYAFIEQDILDWAKQFKIRSLAFDPFQATYMITRLQASYINCVEYPNTVKNISDPMKSVEALTLDGKLFNERRNKCMDWQTSCVMAKLDAKDNIFCRKNEDGVAKIDGFVSLVFAMGRWGLEEQDNSHAVGRLITL